MFATLLPAVFKTHTDGLCGNYNEDGDDDHTGYANAAQGPNENVISDHRRKRSLASHRVLK